MYNVSGHVQQEFEMTHKVPVANAFSNVQFCMIDWSAYSLSPVLLRTNKEPGMVKLIDLCILGPQERSP